MSERPQVYKAGKVEKLEFYRDRLEKSNRRDRGKVAMEQERAIHEVLVQLVQEQETIANEVRAMRKEMRALMERLTGEDR